MSPEEARERFSLARVARLATVDVAGRPHLVAIVFALAEETLYSVVDDKPKRTTDLKRLKNLRANPAASVLVDHYEDADWSTLWWVRADGSARVLEPDEAEACAAVELLLARYPQQRPMGAVIAVDVERWTHWSVR